MPSLIALYRSVAYIVCARKNRTRLDELETPHGHPEPPSDALLADFFCPNWLRCG